MTSLRTFTGEFPRLTADLLPENAATSANNCDFSRGDLRPLKGNSALVTMVNSVLGLYTEDGLNFFTWAEDANAVRGPVLEDQYFRVYYTTPSGFRVTQRTLAQPTGGTPSSSWKVGVPKPTAAPTSSVGAAGTLPDGIVLTWKFFYDANGTRYQEQTITPTLVTLGREYTFTAPDIEILDRATDDTEPPVVDTIVSDTAEAFKATPDNAIPVVEVTGTLPSGTQAFKVFSSNSTFAANNDNGEINGLTVSLSAVPGGVTTVRFDYGAGFQQTRAFVYTAVNLWDEESAPSLPLLVTYDIMQVPTLTLPAITTTDFVPVTRFRVYGSVSANSGDTDYQLVGEVSTTGIQVTYAVTSKPSTWGRLLDTIGHEPPSQSLIGLVSMPNGVLCASDGNELHFCESYKPWAWNPEYVIALPYGIKGKVVSGSALVVSTTANPYIVSGTLPENMIERKLEAIQAGVSKNGICDCGGFVAYVSNDGLVTVSGGQASLAMGQRFFTRDTWRERYAPAVLEAMKLAYHDGALIGYTPSNGGFVIRFDEATGSMTKMLSLSAAAGFMLPQTDSLYLAVGAVVSEFRAGSTLTALWTSKEFISPVPVNFGAIQVVGTGNITVTVYADGALIAFPSFSGSGVKRLPDGFKARKWQLAVDTTGTVAEIHLARTMKALRNV